MRFFFTASPSFHGSRNKQKLNWQVTRNHLNFFPPCINVHHHVARQGPPMQSSNAMEAEYPTGILQKELTYINFLEKNGSVHMDHAPALVTQPV